MNGVTPAPQDPLGKIEKAVGWVVGLLATVVGSLSGAESWLPKPVAVTLVGVGGVLVAIERYITATRP